MRIPSRRFPLLPAAVLLLGLAGPAQAEEAPQAPATAEELPGSSIIGNKELPVGLDFVPWRPAPAGEVREGPTQLLDEPLTPIDPEVFRRRLDLYENTRR